MLVAGRHRSGIGDTAVWVESPLQLICAVEAYAAGLLGAGAAVSLRSGGASLPRTARALTALGLPEGLRLLVGQERPAGPPPDASAVWATGDVFSGLVQRALVSHGLLRRSRCRIVVVDDGLATLHLLHLLGRPRAPLTRSRSRERPLRRLLGLVANARLRAAAAEGRFTVLTALPVGEDTRRVLGGLGVDLRSHAFEWLQTRPSPPVPEEDLVVLGTALVHDGLVRREPYLDWVRGLAAQTPVAYYPHRREARDVLAELRRHPRISVRVAGPPAELRLRGLEPRHRVVTLPSTAALSLPVLLRARGVRVDATPVPAPWWTESTAASTRAHLNEAAVLNRTLAR